MAAGTIPCVQQACPLCARDGARVVGRGRDFEFATCPDEWVFKRCDDCDVVYLDPRPELEALPLIYPHDYYAPSANAERGGAVLRAKSWVIRRRIRGYLRHVRESCGTILDIGCSDGHFLSLFEAEGIPASRLAGLDFNQRSIERVQARGYQVLSQPVEELSLAPGSCSLILMSQVIEHLVDPAQVITRCVEWLEPGGCLVLETPSIDSLDFKLFSRRHWGGYHIPRHWVLFSHRSLQRVVEQAGLQVIEVSSLPSPFMWVWSVHHWLAEQGAPAWLAERFQWKSVGALALFTLFDMARIPFAHTSNMRVVGRKWASP